MRTPVSSRTRLSWLPHDSSAPRGVFLFEYSREGGALLAWSGDARAVLGVRDGEIVSEGDLFLRHLHVDDRFRVMNELEVTLRTGGGFRSTYRWVRPDTEEIRWLHCRADMLEERGRFCGAIVDLTPELSGQVTGLEIGSLLPLVDSDVTLILVLDGEMRVLAVHPIGACEILPFGDPEFDLERLVVGRPFLGGFRDVSAGRALLERLRLDVLALGEPLRERVEVRSLEGDGSNVTVLEVYAAPLDTEAAQSQRLLISVRDRTRDEVRERELYSARQVRSEWDILSSGLRSVVDALAEARGIAALLARNPTHAELVTTGSRALDELVSRIDPIARSLSSGAESSPREVSDLNVTVLEVMREYSGRIPNDVRVSLSFGAVPHLSVSPLDLRCAIQVIVGGVLEHGGVMNGGAGSAGFERLGALSLVIETGTGAGEVVENSAELSPRSTYATVTLASDGPPPDVTVPRRECSQFHFVQTLGKESTISGVTPLSRVGGTLAIQSSREDPRALSVTLSCDTSGFS